MLFSIFRFLLRKAGKIILGRNLIIRGVTTKIVKNDNCNMVMELQQQQQQQQQQKQHTTTTTTTTATKEGNFVRTTNMKVNIGNKALGKIL